MSGRKAVSSYTRANTKTLAAMGDSLTFNDVYWGCAPHQMWPEVLAAQLRTLACPIRGRNFGASGNTTTQMLARASQLTLYEVPDLAIVFGGVNDPGASIAGATTQANIEAMVSGVIAAGCSHVVVVNTQYLNFTTGGDALATPYASYAALRPYQQAAATSQAAAHPGVVAFCDLYASMRALIVSGAETQGSNSWHAVANNQHLNAVGQSYVAAAILATIQAQSGWLKALQA